MAGYALELTERGTPAPTPQPIRMAEDMQPFEEELRSGINPTPSRPRRLPQLGPAFTDDLEAALSGLCQATREVVGADYAALGILDPARVELEYFITAGMDSRTRRQIGAHPRGRGLLGRLMLDEQPLRIEDLYSDPRSYGFPPGHPRMHNFLGAPIVIAGKPWGNLYAADKQGGMFDEDDERALSGMAARAAAIVESARSSR